MPGAATRRLLLVRHGRSNHVHDGSWIDSTSARRFEVLYDAAPIRADDAPPPELRRMADSANVMLASDLLRAVTSARRLMPNANPVVSPLLRELPFELPDWGPRLPLNVWDALHHLKWTARLLTGFENSDTRRAKAAAEWVDAHAGSVPFTIVMTHGGFRRLLTVALTRRGWKPDPGSRRYGNWSAWVLAQR